jgi:cyclase
MLRPRIIPILLLKENALVKSIGFKKHKYIGDPINALRLFNDLKVDELVFLDIDASRENRLVSIALIKNIGEEANMPFAVGGGIKTCEDIRKIIKAGAEKVIINSSAHFNPNFIKEAVDEFGSSTISICIDFKKKLFGGLQTWTHSGTKSSGYSPLDFAKLMEDKGAGEIIIQSITRDGTFLGYDIEMIQKISKAVKIPVVALGGAGSISDLKIAYQEGLASGLAAGSLFVFEGKKRGVLINYPEKKEIDF